jgi:hypothetical protein
MLKFNFSSTPIDPVTDYEPISFFFFFVKSSSCFVEMIPATETQVKIIAVK